MRLSIETWVPQNAVGYESGLRMIADAGFDCCDFSYYGFNSLGGSVSPEEDLLGEDWKERAETLRRILDETGLRCNQAHAPFRFTRENVIGGGDPEWTKIVRSIRSAAILGAEQIIVHTVGNERDRDFEAFNLEFYRSFQPVCAESGIRIGVENLFFRDLKRRCFPGKLGTPEKLTAFLHQLDPRCFTACVDLGHAALTGQEPEEFLAGMSADDLGALHVHDNRYLDDDHLLPWNGDFRWDAIVSALAGIGYRGDLTLEVLGFLKRYDTEMLPAALRYAELMGRELIARFEAAR